MPLLYLRSIINPVYIQSLNLKRSCRGLIALMRPVKTHLSGCTNNIFCVNGWKGVIFGQSPPACWIAFSHTWVFASPTALSALWLACWYLSAASGAHNLTDGIPSAWRPPPDSRVVSQPQSQTPQRRCRASFGMQSWLRVRVSTQWVLCPMLPAHPPYTFGCTRPVQHPGPMIWGVLALMDTLTIPYGQTVTSGEVQ